LEQSEASQKEIDLSKDLLEDAERKAEQSLRSDASLPQIKNIFDGEKTQTNGLQNNSQPGNKSEEKASNNSVSTDSEENPPPTITKKQQCGYSIDDYQG
jgi:hypothetical protein